MTLLHAHLVFVTKYRRKIFNNDMLTACETILRDVCDELDAVLAEFNGEPDHVHLLVTYPTTLEISTLANRLKGTSSHALRKQFTGQINRARMNGHLWTPSYFAVSAGGAPLHIIKQYIEQQNRPT